uniref:Uncharacterized protein LOC102803053 n=1 Tax=Saccoglossus kowalevskii TaxID=10224 RepID=A0ABM0M5J1_SACKO
MHSACYCGTTYDKHGKADEKDCHSKCPGDPVQICGGHSKLSVFSLAENVPPFSVYCEMYTDPNYGVTVIGRENHDEILIDGSTPPTDVTIDYLVDNIDTIKSVVERSAYCAQEITYRCSHAQVHYQETQYVYWFSGETPQYYLDGFVGDSCSCAADGSCAGNFEHQCNCDAAGYHERFDSGFLQNKTYLPVTKVHAEGAHADSVGGITVGDLKCWEVWPTCAQHQAATGDTMVGQYVIDPDGFGGVDPFEVECQFPYTHVPVTVPTNQVNADNPDQEGPGAECFDIEYDHCSIEQLQALAEASEFCMQYAKMECRYAPFVNNGGDPYAYWVDGDGTQHSGWAGSADGPSCACGETGTCEGGETMACQCDMNDDILRADHGLFVNKDVLPVAQVCMGVSEDNVDGEDPERKLQRYTFDDLVCGDEQFGLRKDCEDRRLFDSATVSEPWIIDPDLDGPVEPFPVYCDILEFPGIGVTIVHHHDEGPNDLGDAEGAITVDYYHASPAQLEALTNNTQYCTQSMWFTCVDAILELAAPNGWYDRNGVHMVYWAGNTYGVGCVNGECQCSVLDGQQHTDGGVLLDGATLPVSQVIFPDAVSGSTRILDIGPLTCFGLFRNCHEILLAEANTNPNNDNTYAVDPDLAGGVEPFSVHCDFTSHVGIGISKVWETSETAIDVSPETDVPITYLNADYEQMHELVVSSQFCFQELQYQCQAAHLINEDDQDRGSYYKDYAGNIVRAWAGAESYIDVGCACELTGSCPPGDTCQCDAMRPDTWYDSGHVIDRSKLPISELHFGDVFVGGESSAEAAVKELQCGPIPF